MNTTRTLKTVKKWPIKEIPYAGCAQYDVWLPCHDTMVQHSTAGAFNGFKHCKMFYGMAIFSHDEE